MARLAAFVTSFLILASIALAVGGAEARRASRPSATPDPYPHGFYECWPAEDSTSAGPVA